MKGISKYIGFNLFLLFMLSILGSCSTTKNLPENETLYTGIKKAKFITYDNSLHEREAQNEVEAALNCAPNYAIFGSSYRRWPFPYGVYVYNSFNRYKKGFGKWIFKTFSAKPVLISSVNPATRVKVAQNILKEYGYFNAKTDYELVPNKKNPRKAKINYLIQFNHPHTIDTVSLTTISTKADSLLELVAPNTRFKSGEYFSAVKLDQIRQDMSKYLRNNGYYYFKPEFIHYYADTILKPGKIELRLGTQAGTPIEATKPWYIGKITVNLYKQQTDRLNDSLEFNGLKIHYNNKLRVRSKVLRSRIFFNKGDLYRHKEQEKSLQALSRLGVFMASDMRFTPRSFDSDTLDITLNQLYDLPIDGDFELNLTNKSNNYIGPGMVFGLTRRNIFKGGENLSIKLKGDYEWQRGKNITTGKTTTNSYELGVNGTLSFPRLLLPGKKISELPATTNIRVNFDWMQRAAYFSMISFGGQMSYNFQTSTFSRHIFTPFRLTYNFLPSTTFTFDSIMRENPAIKQSLKNQFIPIMEYTYTYDNASAKPVNRWWWETTISEAGGILSSAYAIGGVGFREPKNLLNLPFAQFLKMTSEVRFNRILNDNSSIAARLATGIIYEYDKNGIAPYSEQFFVGGANSIRAFTIRTIGPGSYVPTLGQYSYLDQVGDFKLEANVEYRFRIIQNLHGAFFLDAGNSWLIKEDEGRPGGTLKLGHIGKDLALGTGGGFRYDLTFLVVRIDVGVALHAPYNTGKSGYFNIPSYKNGYTINFAIGYPF